MTQVSV